MPLPAFTPGAAPDPRAARARWTGYALGVLLLVAAVVIVARDGDTIAAAWRSARSAPFWMIAALAALPLANWLLSSTVLYLLTRRFALVPWSHMSAIVGVATTLNVLPLRPGMLGRLVYLQQHFGVSIPASLVVLGQAILLTLLAAGVTLLGAALFGDYGALLGIGLLVLPCVTRPLRAPRDAPLAPAGNGAAWSAALALRAVEMGVWTARYWLVFQIIGQGIGAPTAVLLAAAAQVVALLPITFGLREWTVGLLSATTPLGLSADLLHRAVELAVSLPLGGLCALWLWRHRPPPLLARRPA